MTDTPKNHEAMPEALRRNAVFLRKKGWSKSADLEDAAAVALAEANTRIRELEALNAERNRQNAACFTENDRLREALEPFLGDPKCAHDRLTFEGGGRFTRPTRTCGECGADLNVFAALQPAAERGG